MNPTLSILVTSYNRKKMLHRALVSIAKQTFTDYEVVVIDDCSTDGTKEFLESIPDERIRPIILPENIGHIMGDREHIRRFVHELARGKYFVYLCSDDYWIKDDLLQRQMDLFEKYPSAGIVMGGQLSVFMKENERKYFHDGVFPKAFMTSNEFLVHFANNPITANITAGARIYNRELFINSGVMVENNEVKWEAGFEFLIGPGCYGDFVYINKADVWTEIWPENASFQGTQLTHFLDSIASIKAGFRKPLEDFPASRNLDQVQRHMIQNICLTYLGNARHIKQNGGISYASPEHCSRVVTQDDVDKVMAELEAA